VHQTAHIFKTREPTLLFDTFETRSAFATRYSHIIRIFAAANIRFLFFKGKECPLHLSFSAAWQQRVAEHCNVYQTLDLAYVFFASTSTSGIFRIYVNVHFIIPRRVATYCVSASVSVCL